MGMGVGFAAVRVLGCQGGQQPQRAHRFFPAFLEMRCKYIHYNVIPLMKTDKHFHRSETYFTINFNIKAQGQSTQRGNRGQRCARILLQCSELTVVT